MAITLSSVVGTPINIKCNGGGFVMYVRAAITLTAVASSPFDSTFMTDIGAPQGKVIGADFCKSDGAMEEDGGGDGLSPYVDYANQALQWRSTLDGAVAALTPIKQDAGGLVLDLVVVV